MLGITERSLDQTRPYVQDHLVSTPYLCAHTQTAAASVVNADQNGDRRHKFTEGRRPAPGAVNYWSGSSRRPQPRQTARCYRPDARR
jgi:hypothetical protein